MNRNYFHRPYQGNGRDSYDYGRSDLMRRAEPRVWIDAAWAGLAVAGFTCGFVCAPWIAQAVLEVLR